MEDELKLETEITLHNIDGHRHIIGLALLGDCTALASQIAVRSSIDLKELAFETAGALAFSIAYAKLTKRYKTLANGIRRK